MVRLHTSLLAVTLSTGSALASSKEYQRRELRDQVQSHGPLSFRLGRAGADFQSRGFVDAFDDLEERGPQFSSVASVIGNIAANVAQTRVVNVVGRIAGRVASHLKHRGLEDEEDLLVRDLDAEELFVREYDLFDERDYSVDDLD